MAELLEGRVVCTNTNKYSAMLNALSRILGGIAQLLSKTCAPLFVSVYVRSVVCTVHTRGRASKMEK